MASDFSRRDFLATGGAVVAGVFVPDWAAAFQPGTSDNARRTEVTDAALAHAAKIGASYADIRINRYRRESITTREQQVQNVSRSTSYGFGSSIGSRPPKRVTRSLFSKAQAKRFGGCGRGSFSQYRT